MVRVIERNGNISMHEDLPQRSGLLIQGSATAVELIDEKGA